MRLVRQLRGHLRIVATPTCLGLVILVAAAIAVRARNASAVIAAGRQQVNVMIDGGLHVAWLQMATLAGVGVAATAAASFSGLLSTRRDEQLIAILEPSVAVRWALRYVSVVLAVLAGVLLTTVATLVAASVQALRLDNGPVHVTLGRWASLLIGPAAHGLLVIATFAALAVLVAGVLRTSPAVAAASSVGGAFALLLIQHLLGGRGDVLVPTAWVGRWLHLTSDDFGTAYVWTVGSFSDGRTAAGLALALLAVAGASLGWLVILRSARA